MFRDIREVYESHRGFHFKTGRFITMKAKTPTVSAKFSDSLSHLIDTMTRCQPTFIRCIKPNNDKTPNKLEFAVVLEQLRNTGMLETVRIRKLGFPRRYLFEQFAKRFVLSQYSFHLLHSAVFLQVSMSVCERLRTYGCQRNHHPYSEQSTDEIRREVPNWNHKGKDTEVTMHFWIDFIPDFHAWIFGKSSRKGTFTTAEQSGRHDSTYSERLYSTKEFRTATTSDGCSPETIPSLDRSEEVSRV